MYVLALDVDAIIAHPNPETLTLRLEMARDRLTRSEVITRYLLIDELLSYIVCRHYFGNPRAAKVMKTKRFRTFNHFILEKLYLHQKLDLARAIHDIPKWVSSDAAALNDLRNAVVHSYFPENRRKKAEWKGHDIFTNEGFDGFIADMSPLGDFFFKLLGWKV